MEQNQPEIDITELELEQALWDLAKLIVKETPRPREEA